MKAKENSGNLVILWLDLANAYGSLPHKIIRRALHRHHVPDNIIVLIHDYYIEFKLIVNTNNWNSDWHIIERYNNRI